MTRELGLQAALQDGDMPHLPRDARVYVAGHRGLVGSAIMRHLHTSSFTNLLTRTRSDLDLRDPPAIDAFFAAERPR